MLPPKMRKLLAITLLTLFVLPLQAVADEGMWLLSLLKKNNEAAMKELGLQIPVEEIMGDPEGALCQAVVSFGSGCTASLISDKGLLLTNYHCSYSAIQQLSSLEHNLFENGFWARSHETELPVKGLSIVLNKKIIDISDEVNARLEASGRSNENTRKAMDEVAAKHATRGLKNMVKSYKNGSIHILYQQQVFEDIRLVGVPPRSVAKFGGETDNWMWPRHSADFAYFRVYVSKEGNPATYAGDNIPYTPAKHLNISTGGHQKGDFAMSIGYPMYTDRQATSTRIAEIRNTQNIPMIDVRGLRMEILKRRMDADPGIQLTYYEKYSTAVNYLKNARGMNEWIDRLDVIKGKQALESDLVRWISGDAERRNRYPEVEAYLESLSAADSETRGVLAYFHEAFGENSDMLRFAGAFGGWMHAIRFNPGGGAGKLSDFIATARHHYKGYDKTMDAEITKATLKMLREKLPERLLPSFYADIDRDFGGDLEAYVDSLYEKSIFSDLDRIIAWTGKADRDYNSDPVVRLLHSVNEKRSEIEKIARQSPRARPPGGAARYTAALTEYRNEAYYPDADGTARLSYGTVQELETDAGRLHYQTFLSELMAKEDPANSDYHINDQLKKLWESKEFRGYGSPDDMPVCFITNGDVTGGNSGSPMLNGHGEVIGLVFDCNWESMTRDYNYNKEMNRVICVDIRYVLLITEAFSGTDNILRELSVARSR